MKLLRFHAIRRKSIKTPSEATLTDGETDSSGTDAGTSFPTSPMTPRTVSDKIAIDKLKQQYDLFDLLHFKHQPSKELCQLYEFARDEGSAGFLECWLALRSYHLLFRRYKAVKRQFWGSNGQLNPDDFVSVPDFAVDEHEDLNLTQLIAGDINSMYVDKRILHRFANFILESFLTQTGSSIKPIDVPIEVVESLTHQIDEHKYEPVIFKQVRDHLYLSIEKGIYRRFLQNIHDNEDS